MNGNRIKARVSVLPLKLRLSNTASHSPSASLKTVVTTVYRQVFHTATRKMLSFQTSSKFCNPTKWPGTPTLVSVTDSMMPLTNG